MRRFLVPLLFSLLFLSCEDKKNASAERDFSSEDKSPTRNISKDTETPSEDEMETNSAEEFVYITDENVEAFLTKYGEENPETKVEIETIHGTIKLELFTSTPLHRANFIYLIKSGYLNTTFFHRVVNNFMIQGGNSDRVETNTMRRKIGRYTIPAEIRYKHTRGALSAAKEYRDNPDDRSSSYEFFIVQSHNGAHHLDPNYTVFGKVTAGMDVVDTIAALDTDDREWPVHNIFMEVRLID